MAKRKGYRGLAAVLDRLADLDAAYEEVIGLLDDAALEALAPVLAELDDFLGRWIGHLQAAAPGRWGATGKAGRWGPAGTDLGRLLQALRDELTHVQTIERDALTLLPDVLEHWIPATEALLETLEVASDECSQIGARLDMVDAARAAQDGAVPHRIDA